MIDLHTHLLPYIDDGAGSLEEALQMTEALRLQNIMTAVCTPHFDPSRIGLQDFVDKRTSSLALMKASKVKLIPASETYLHEYLFHYSELSPLCIGPTRYLLVELPYCDRWKAEDFENLHKIINYYNLLPIIAHIERYPAAGKEKLIEKLIDMGCLLQMNTTAILDKKINHRAFRYIKKSLIDVLGSDCHNMTERPPVITPALERINRKAGSSFVERFKRNADNIIEGIEIRSNCKRIMF